MLIENNVARCDLLLTLHRQRRVLALARESELAVGSLMVQQLTQIREHFPTVAADQHILVA